MPDHPTDPNTQAPSLGPDDARLLDALIEGSDQDRPTHDTERAEALHKMLGLIDQWDAHGPNAGLAERALARVITAEPVSLSEDDGVALDALLAAKRLGLDSGPMPAGTGARTQRLSQLCALLDRIDDGPVPGGLADRTMQAVEAETERRRLTIGKTPDAGRWRPAGGSIRQVATTAALLLMVLSVLLPVLEKSKRDAGITACNANLAGLGVDLQRLANDNKDLVGQPAQPEIFRHLSGFARSPIDGEPVPAHTATLFILLNEQQAPSAHRACPSAAPGDPSAYYNGQNPIAGGPFRMSLEPRPIFADTNPLYRVTPAGLVRNASIPGMTQSKNHDGVGQNVLISDGSVEWKVRPTVNRPGQSEADNIWLHQPLRPGESGSDVFLTP